MYGADGGDSNRLVIHGLRLLTQSFNNDRLIALRHEYAARPPSILHP